MQAGPDPGGGSGSLPQAAPAAGRLVPSSSRGSAGKASPAAGSEPNSSAGGSQAAPAAPCPAMSITPACARPPSSKRSFRAGDPKSKARSGASWPCGSRCALPCPQRPQPRRGEAGCGKPRTRIALTAASLLPAAKQARQKNNSKPGARRGSRARASLAGADQKPISHPLLVVVKPAMCGHPAALGILPSLCLQVGTHVSALGLPAGLRGSRGALHQGNFVFPPPL